MSALSEPEANPRDGSRLLRFWVNTNSENRHNSPSRAPARAELGTTEFAQRGCEASQAPVEAHAPAGLDLTYPSVNPRTFGSDPGYGPGGGFHIDEFPVPASLVAEVAVHRGARPENGRRRGLFSVLTTISVAATAFVGPLLLARMSYRRCHPRLPRHGGSPPAPGSGAGGTLAVSAIDQP